MCNDKKGKAVRVEKGHIFRCNSALSVCFRGKQDIQQHQRESHNSSVETRVNKAKVYESKGTPNYSYTIHD